MMGVNFNHKDIIFSLKNDFPEFLTKKLRKKGLLKEEVVINQVSPPYRTGSGNSEQLWDENRLIIDKKRFLLTFKEDASGSLVILINKEPVYFVKPSGRLTSMLIDSLVCSIDKVLAEQNG